MVKVAVIGIGRMGGTHARNLFKNKIKGGALLVALCDSDLEKTEKLKEDFKGIKVYTTVDELISQCDFDAVIISVPHYYHASIAMKCLNAKKHVLLEKPLTVTAKEAQELIKCANENKRLIFGIMFNQRTNPLYVYAKKIIEEKRIGNIKRVNVIITDWYRTDYYYRLGGWRASWTGEGGGTLINQCVHQLDILQWLTGMPKRVIAWCETENRNINTENKVDAIFDYDDYKCHFSASACEIPGTNRIEIAGDKGRIIIDKRKMTCTFCKKSESEVNESATRDYGNKKDKKNKKIIKRYPLIKLIKEGLRGGQQASVIDAFVMAVGKQDKSLLIVDGREGINTVEILNGVYMSSWQGKQVELPVDKEEYEKLLNQKAQQEQL